MRAATDGDPLSDGSAVVTAERHKDNLGFRFTQLVLERDPETLLLTWNESASVYAYGAPVGHAVHQKPSTSDPAETRRYLARQAVKLLRPSGWAPKQKRAKRAVEDLLAAQATKDGFNKVKEGVRSFLAGCCEFETVQDGKAKRVLLVGVRNPDASLEEHGDLLAGRLATPEGSGEPTP